jgi:hypothetical protein
LPWKVETTSEFEKWWDILSESEQICVDAYVQLLERYGPTLPRPYSDAVRRSKHSNMKELRIQHKGKPYRILYAFDPRRVAVLLIGGDKTGDERWYEKYVPFADQLYDEHITLLEE